MSLADYNDSLDRKVGTIPRIGPRVIKGITIGKRHEEEEGFGRKQKTQRAKLVVAEAKRALEYIAERQRIESMNLAALEESKILSDDLSIQSFLARPKEPLTDKPYRKTKGMNVVDLYEPKDGRKYQVNFLGSPLKETWPKEENKGPLFVGDGDGGNGSIDSSPSGSVAKSTRRKAKIFVTDQGSVASSHKFVTQRSHALADGLHVTDISPDRMAKYFGDSSKEKFYDTYRELNRQKLLLPITRTKKGVALPDLNSLVSLSVEDHPVNKSISDLVGLGVVRPSTVDSTKPKRMDSLEVFNVHSFAEYSVETPARFPGDQSVSSSITDGPRERLATQDDNDMDSLFSDEENGLLVESPEKPLFPFVSIFANEKGNERRKSVTSDSYDLADAIVGTADDSSRKKSTVGGGLSRGPSSRNMFSTPEGKQTTKGKADSLPRTNTSSSNRRGNGSFTKTKNDKKATPSKSDVRPSTTAARAHSRVSSSGTPIAKQNTKKVNLNKKSSDTEKHSTPKKKPTESICSSMDTNDENSESSPRRLQSNEGYVSFASEHPFEPLDLPGSSINENSEFDGAGESGIHLSSILREDDSSDDENIRHGGDNEGYMTYGMDSPRAKFLAGCIDKKIPPRNALMLRSKVSSVLFLEHHGMGDDLALLLAPALAAMPLVSGVNIADNNLTDIGLEAIISSIAKCEKVRDFDISENIIGPKAATALATLLGNPDCKLSKITMRKANVDDGECERFVEALKTNRHLQELDMSDNLLGKDENLNAVKPDIVTAGEALASLLREGNCPLTTLKIAWNMIRMEGAYELCTALESCRTLQHIDISFNALGRESGIALGTSIALMPCLKELLLSNNGLDPMATFTLCVGARDCPSMSYLCLDNNPIGDLGLRAILTNVVYCGSRLNISARGCDFTLVIPDCSYKRSDPTGGYDINLSNGFDRAILIDAMDAVAIHQSLTIQNFQYFFDGNDFFDYTLTKFDEKRSVETFDRHENNEIDTLHRMHRTLSNDNVKSKMISLFVERQHPGVADKSVVGLYRDEAADLIEGIGRVEYSDSQFKTLFAYYDVCDDSTIISSFIFVQMIDKIESEALLRIRDACNLPRFSINEAKSRYIPPMEGRIKMKVIDTFVNRPDGYGLTNYQTQMMHHVSQNHADVSIGLSAVMELFKVRCEEATSLFHILMENSGDPANALATILPCLTTSPDIRAIINMYGRNPTTQRRLEQRMGNAYRAYVGPIDGFYHIDFRVSTDRLCLRKLMQISASNCQRRKMLNLGDISQNGDWSSFRNKYYASSSSDHSSNANSEIVLNNAALTPMPTSGIIEFDFSGAPRGGVKLAESIGNEWFVNSLVQLGLISEDRFETNLKWLDNVEIKQRKNSTGAGQSLWQRDLGRSAHISNYLYEKIFHPTQLSRRHSRMLEGLAKERALQSELTAKAKAEAEAIERQQKMDALEKNRNGGKVSRRPSTLLSRPPSRGIETPKDIIEERVMSEENEGVDEYADGLLTPDEVTGEAGEKGVDQARLDDALSHHSVSRATTPDTVKNRRASAMVAKKPVDRYAIVKAAKMVRSVLDMYDNGKLMYARQLALLMTHFANGSVMRSDYGSYRVELAVSLFSRVKDIQNFDIVLAHLNATEAACATGRLGMLTLFNPMKPENCYELDMAYFEQRQIAKMLIHFAVVEPGVNWFNQKYAVDRAVINILGWELSLMWNSKEHLPEKGILACRYYAGDGFCMKQCRPVKKLRYDLLALALVDADDLRDEEAEYLLDKSLYRQIAVEDKVYATPTGKTRKHQAKFSTESNVPGSSIPVTTGDLCDLNGGLLEQEITWTYDNLSDAHP